MPQFQLEVEGMTANQVYSTLVTGGLTQSAAATLVSSWIFEHFGRVERKFNYAQDFPAVDPACVATFARTFHHADWVDGESVVQAEATTGEEGFNRRFHEIENDLDGLAADVAKAFVCLASMRRALFNLLAEVRAEINRLNSDVHDCCSRRGPAVGPVTQLPSYVDLIDNPYFLGATVLGDRPVQMWRTDRGLVVLPTVAALAPDVVVNPRVTRAGALARYFAENRRVQDFFGDRQVSRRQLVERFGDEPVREGMTVRDVVSILPEDSGFRMGEMVEAVTEREAAALRTTSGSAQAVASAFGIEFGTEKVADVRLDRVKNIPPQARAVLLQRGIETVGKLAGANPAEVARLLQAEGVEGVTVGDASEWTAVAKTFSKLG
jgi:hypothetical protein